MGNFIFCAVTALWNSRYSIHVLLDYIKARISEKIGDLWIKYETETLQDRSSHPEVFPGKSVLKKWSKLKGQHPRRSVISHFGMGVLLYICCIFSPFLESTSGRLFLTLRICKWSIVFNNKSTCYKNEFFFQFHLIIFIVNVEFRRCHQILYKIRGFSSNISLVNINKPVETCRLSDILSYLSKKSLKENEILKYNFHVQFLSIPPNANFHINIKTFITRYVYILAYLGVKQ